MIEWETAYDKYLAYLESSTWAEKRNAALLRDKMHCSICGDPNNIEVHHLRYPEILGEESIACLMTLCHECHSKLEAYKKGHYQVGKYRPWYAPRMPQLHTWFKFPRVSEIKEFLKFFNLEDGKNIVVFYAEEEKQQMEKYLSDGSLNSIKEFARDNNLEFKETFD